MTEDHKLTLDEQIERAYCKQYMQRIVEAELDPTNFTQAMRDRKKGSQPGRSPLTLPNLRF